MLTCDARDSWIQFLEFVKKRCSVTAFENWIAPIRVLEVDSDTLKLEVPNIFVKAYLLDNYKKDLCSFLPVTPQGEPAVEFVIRQQTVKPISKPTVANEEPIQEDASAPLLRLNQFYRFENFIEGPSNQFVKSAAKFKPS